MVKMKALIEGKIGGVDFFQIKESGETLFFGPHCFTLPINGRDTDVLVDFNSYKATTNPDGTLLIEAGTKNSFNDGGLSIDFEEEYHDSGFGLEDLTASVLSEMTEIMHFGIESEREDEETDFIHILALSFEDETGKYDVNPEVLDRFNEMELYEEIREWKQKN